MLPLESATLTMPRKFLIFLKINNTLKHLNRIKLILLNHFIGDIHQPLHVSLWDDKGANLFFVEWYGKRGVLGD
jgi:hypothetical protein